MAITPPPRVRVHLETPVRQLRALPEVAAHAEEYRWTSIDAWHITLAFLGEVDDRLLPELERRMARAAARHAALRLSLAAGGAFSSRRRARVLWVGVRGDTERLGALARSVAAGARRAKIDVDAKDRFRPHLTLARLRQPTDVTAAVETLRGYAGPRWRAPEITVIRSRLGQGPGGRAVHEPVSTYPLADEG